MKQEVKHQDFASVTVFILAVEEKESLKNTVNIIEKTCDKNDVNEIVIVLKSDSCPSNKYCDSFISSDNNFKIVKYIQQGKNLIESLSELPPMAKGSHFIIMSADMETSPNIIKDFIVKAKEHPDAIISASKWNKHSTVENYGVFRKACSLIVNRFVGRLFSVDGSDFFSFYEIYPVSIYKNTDFTNKNNLIYEYTLLPLKNGVKYYEIPTYFNKRVEGKTHFNFKTNAVVTLKFIKTAIRLKLNHEK